MRKIKTDNVCKNKEHNNFLVYPEVICGFLKDLHYTNNILSLIIL